MSLIQVLVAVAVITLSVNVANAAKPNENAPKGGNFTRNLGGEPPSLHPISYSDLYGQIIVDQICDTLATRDIETLEFKPRLAEKWETSKDGKVITFTLRKNAVFHDGKPVTAEDVKYSYDAIFEPAFNAADKRVYYEGVQKVEVVDPYTVRFTLKNTYFQNFLQIAELFIIPKHIYSDVEKSKKLTRTLTCSGPHVLDKFDKGQRIVIKRFDKWYGWTTPEWKGAYNFETISFKFVKEDAVSFEMVKKGDLDYEDLTPEYYLKKAEGDPWGKTVFKNKVENAAPKGYGFIGWNFRKEMFQEKNVRVALSHLMNRTEMNQKFRFGMAELATGPVYVQSDYASPSVKPILFDPKKAQELLAKSGWKDSDKDGVLDKTVNGKKVDFKFSLIHPNKDSEKYWTMYKEDLKKSGIDMEIKYLEWNSFLKILDEGNFEAVALAWSASLDWDPKQVWHSSGAVPGGSNFIAYKNTEVDKLIEEARLEVDKKKRITKLRKVYEMIAADAPYVFMFNDKYAFYANSNKISKPADTFKYGIGREYWWSAKQQP